MIPVWLWFALIPSCIVIAIIDFIIFSDWTKCPKCGSKNDRWYNFLLPTVLEILLFLSGIAIGVMVTR